MTPPKSLEILDFVGKRVRRKSSSRCQGAQGQFLGPSPPLEVKAERGWRKVTQRGNLKPRAVVFGVLRDQEARVSYNLEVGDVGEQK